MNFDAAVWLLRNGPKNATRANRSPVRIRPASLTHSSPDNRACGNGSRPGAGSIPVGRGGAAVGLFNGEGKQ